MANEPIINPNIRARSPMPSAIASERGGRTPGRIFPYYKPQRMLIIDRSKGSGEVGNAVPVLMNPADFSISGASEYSRLDVPGYSQQVVQWSHTQSLEFNFTLRWSYQVASERRGNRGLKTVDSGFYRWLLSFLRPLEAGRAPPLMQIYWPNFLSIIGNVTNVSVGMTRWSREGVPVDYTIELSLLESSRVFVSASAFTLSGLRTPLAPGLTSDEVDRVSGPALRKR